MHIGLELHFSAPIQGSYRTKPHVAFQQRFTIFRKFHVGISGAKELPKVHELKLESYLLVDVVKMSTYRGSLLYKEIIQRRNR